MSALRAVIFDLGHTVWDFAPSVEARRYQVLRLQAALEAELGDRAPAPARVDRVLNDAVTRWVNRWNDPAVLEQPPSESILEDTLAALDLLADPAFVRELTHIALGQEVEMPKVEPDTLAAIAELHDRGLLMGCITNTILLDTGIHDALERLGLKRYFTSVVVSSIGGYRKPHESLFRRALAELAVEPGEAIFVGDRLIDDVSGAKGIGMRAVLTRQYRQEPLEGAPCSPDAVIERLGHLPRAIEEMEARM